MTRGPELKATPIPIPPGLPRTKPGRGQSLWEIALRRLARDPSFLAGGIIVAVMAVLAAFAPAIAPYDPLEIRAIERLRPPEWAHLLGTDNFGRDVFSRILYGARISLQVGLFVVALTTAAGAILGVLAGYFPRLDNPLMRVMDALMAFPAILLAMAITAALGPSQLNVVVALSVVYVPRTARVVRGSVLALREQPFVEAARAVGSSDPRIIGLHVLPNCLSPILVQATFVFAYAILAEAGLSFIGAGTPPPTPSWGNVLSEGRAFMRDAPWVTFFPGVAIALTVLGLNLLGDALRDALDPRDT
jgi:peptide/nickel transport system permease protein